MSPGAGIITDTAPGRTSLAAYLKHTRPVTKGDLINIPTTKYEELINLLPSLAVNYEGNDDRGESLVLFNRVSLNVHTGPIQISNGGLMDSGVKF